MTQGPHKTQQKQLLPGQQFSQDDFFFPSVVLHTFDIVILQNFEPFNSPYRVHSRQGKIPILIRDSKVKSAAFVMLL